MAAIWHAERAPETVTAAAPLSCWPPPGPARRAALCRSRSLSRLSDPTRAVDLVEIVHKSKESQCAAGEKPHTVEIARVARWGALVGSSVLLRDF